jgi:hypothetical protein
MKRKQNAPAYYTQWHVLGSAISNGTEPRSCLGRVFNIKLGSFVLEQHNIIFAQLACPLNDIIFVYFLDIKPISQQTLGWSLPE